MIPLDKQDQDTQTDLDNILTQIWRSLLNGLDDRASPFRHPVMATKDADGQPQARYVMLDHVDNRRWSVCFGTDIRSAKTKAVHKNPYTVLVMHEPRHQMQLRLIGKASIHINDAIANTAWNNADAQKRQLYSAPQAPGTPIESPATVDTFDTNTSRRNFACIAVDVHTIEWSGQGPQGALRRAKFTLGADKLTITSQWLSP